MPSSFSDFRREMERFFSRFWDEENAGGRFQPRCNFVESETAYEVTAELPGVSPEDVHVEIKNNELWIRGEKRADHEIRGRTYHRVERQFGRFQHVTPLAQPVDEDRIQAEFANGLLKITMPKSDETRARRIVVRSTPGASTAGSTIFGSSSAGSYPGSSASEPGSNSGSSPGGTPPVA